MADITDELIALERSSEEAREKLAGLVDEEERAEQRALWVAAAAEFQAAAKAHAEATGQSRLEVEMAAKAAVRHPEAAE